MPMSPARMGVAHFCPAGQQICFLPVLQHERLFGQHPALPQQREVDVSQHFCPHSSSFGQQRLQRPVLSLAQCHFGGQHLSLPHHAWFGGQRLVQTCDELVPTRIARHSSFGWQHAEPQPRSPRLQQSFCRGFAQYWLCPQHVSESPQVFTQTQLDSPGCPQRVPGGHALAPVGRPFFG